MATETVYADEEDSEEHVLHMWEPLGFETKQSYDYLRTGRVLTLLNAVYRGAATGIMAVLNKVVWGFSCSGRENVRALGAGGAVTVCNHVHQMDCTMVDYAMLGKRMYYVTLESNFRIPLVRHVIRGLGGVPLSTNRRRMGELMNSMGRGLRSGSCVQIYPEGVLLPYCRGLRSFRTGAFMLAVKNGVPVLPMRITFRSPYGIYRLYKRKPCIHLEVLPALAPDMVLPAHDAANRLAERCRAVMEAAGEGCPVA